MKISILVISLLLQSIFSNFLALNISFLNPLFALSALIIVFPYYKKKNEYLITAFIYGVCYNILFPGFILIHSFLFLLVAILIMLMYKLWTSHVVSMIIFQVIVIVVYQNVYYIIITIVDKLEWSSLTGFLLIIRSLISNIVFISLLYIITEKISKKYKIKKFC
jgi:hypothetical protein